MTHTATHNTTCKWTVTGYQHNLPGTSVAELLLAAAVACGPAEGLACGQWFTEAGRVASAGGADTYKLTLVQLPAALCCKGQVLVGPKCSFSTSGNALALAIVPVVSEHACQASTVSHGPVFMCVMVY